MKDINITKIKKVVEIDHDNFDQYIEQGYVLLHVCSKTEILTSGSSCLEIIYVMGHE